jgi:hypothetical protein
MKRVKSIQWRMLGVLVGLTLGWYAAGLAFPPGVIASDAHTATNGAAMVHHDDDPAIAAAAHLVPTDVHGQVAAPTWYRGVLSGAAGLFIAAVALGVPVTRLKTPPPTERAASSHAH